MFIVLCMYTCT